MLANENRRSTAADEGIVLYLRNTLGGYSRLQQIFPYYLGRKKPTVRPIAQKTQSSRQDPIDYRKWLPLLQFDQFHTESLCCRKHQFCYFIFHRLIYRGL